MTPEERFERIEFHLATVAERQAEAAQRQNDTSKWRTELEHWQAEGAKWRAEREHWEAESEKHRAATGRHLEYMAARQQYHDEAFDRMDAFNRELGEKVKEVVAAISMDAANIRRLAGIANDHADRIADLEDNAPQA